MERNELERLVRAALDEDGRLTCAVASRLAKEAGVAPRAVGELCDELGIRIRDCQLGCF